MGAAGRRIAKAQKAGGVVVEDVPLLFLGQEVCRLHTLNGDLDDAGLSPWYCGLISAKTATVPAATRRRHPLNFLEWPRGDRGDVEALERLQCGPKELVVRSRRIDWPSARLRGFVHQRRERVQAREDDLLVVGAHCRRRRAVHRETARVQVHVENRWTSPAVGCSLEVSGSEKQRQTERMCRSDPASDRSRGFSAQGFSYPRAWGRAHIAGGGLMMVLLLPGGGCQRNALGRSYQPRAKCRPKGTRGSRSPTIIHSFQQLRHLLRRGGASLGLGTKLGDGIRQS
jgi:hypothetical protein